MSNGVLDLAFAANPQILEYLNAGNPYPVDPEAARAMAAQFQAPDMVGEQLRAQIAQRGAENEKDYSRGKWLALARAGFTAADKGIGAGANAGLNDLAGVISQRKSARDKELDRQTQLLMLDQGRANQLAQSAQGFYTKGIDTKAGNRTSALNTSINLAGKEIDDKRADKSLGIQAAQARYAMRSPEQIYEEYRKIMGPDEAMRMITGGGGQETAQLYAIKGRMNSLESLMKNGELDAKQQAEYDMLSQQLYGLLGMGQPGAEAAPAQGIAALAAAPTGGRTVEKQGAALPSNAQPNQIASRIIGASGGNPDTALARVKNTPDSVMSPAEKKLLIAAIKEQKAYFDKVAKANSYKAQ